MHEPGTHFVYNTAGTYMLSAMVQKAHRGSACSTTSRPRLFEPLGIEGATWEQSPDRDRRRRLGLSGTTEDIARSASSTCRAACGTGGRSSRRAGSAQATAKQVPNGGDPDSDWAQGYGYQFWRGRHGATAATAPSASTAS